MTLIKSTIAVLAILSSSAFSLAYGAAAAGRDCGDISGHESVVNGENIANRNCTWCHGPSLQGFAIAPRLAGQNREYIEIQLRRLRDQTRDNPFSRKYMSHVAATITPEKACELAHYFSTIEPKAASDGDASRVSAGRIIFERGVPSQNVPACAFCHGPNAQGTGVFPRLGGQSYHYLKRRLEQWNQGYNAVAEHMPGIARTLSAEQIEALSSYLSFVK